jgi:hypothetical protein
MKTSMWIVKMKMKMMMRKMSKEKTFTPYFHLSECKSTDENNPDEIICLVVDAEPTPTTYSTNIEVDIQGKGLHIFPLHNFESNNKSLLNLFTKLYQEQKIKDGSSIVFKTWMGISTRDANRKLRRWTIKSIS